MELLFFSIFLSIFLDYSTYSYLKIGCFLKNMSKILENPLKTLIFAEN